MDTKKAWLINTVIVLSLVALLGVAINLIWLQSTRRAAITLQRPTTGITHVFLRNDALQPATIMVPVGTVVTWTNQDSAAHELILPQLITSVSQSNDSGSLSQGQSFSFAFTATGTFPYYCTHDRSMTGVVIVTPPVF